LRGDFLPTVRALARFLGHDLGDGVLENIRQKSAFDAMQSEKFSNMHEIKEFKGFFRKGSVGSWKEQFTPEQDALFSAMIERRLAGTGLEFDYD